ncbi:MAG: hypothetical protein WD646_12700 [Actinomycetota bacterium]
MPDERPGRRAFQIYLYAVCLVTVVVVLFSSASAVYALIRIAAPGTTAQGGDSGFAFPTLVDEDAPLIRSGGFDTGDAERDRGIASLAENGIFALAAAAIFWWHWQQSVRLRAEIAAESSKPAAPTRTRTRRKA